MIRKLNPSLNIEPVFRAALESADLSQPATEYRFHPKRCWRFDYTFPEKKVAVEVEGDAFIRGRHTRGAGFRRDLEKYSEAGASAGWSFACCRSSFVRNARSDGSGVRWRGRCDAEGLDRGAVDMYTLLIYDEHP